MSDTRKKLGLRALESDGVVGLSAMYLNYSPTTQLPRTNIRYNTWQAFPETDWMYGCTGAAGAGAAAVATTTFIAAAPAA